MGGTRAPFLRALIISSVSRSACAATRLRARTSIALNPIAAHPKATMTITELTP
jgi:hypothetical protein